MRGWETECKGPSLLPDSTPAQEEGPTEAVPGLKLWAPCLNLCPLVDFNNEIPLWLDKTRSH